MSAESHPLPLEPLVAGIPIPELLTALPDGVGVMENGVIRYHNQAVSEILGYAVGELLGRSPLEFLHPEDRDRAMDRMARVMEGGVDAPARYRRGTPTGAGCLWRSGLGWWRWRVGRPC